MAKEEWGVKRVCPTTGKRFYDLNRSPIISPYTGDVVELETGKKSTVSAVSTREKAIPEKAAKESDEAVIDDVDAADVELGDDVLDDDDDDDDTVALDDLADVAAEDDDS